MSDLTDDRLAEMISQADHAGMWETVRALIELRHHRTEIASKTPGGGWPTPGESVAHDASILGQSGLTEQQVAARIGAAPRCHQDPSINAAWCAVHDECPDWSSDVAGYRGPVGWVCHPGGMLFDQQTSDAALRAHNEACAGATMEKFDPCLAQLAYEDVESQRDQAQAREIVLRERLALGKEIRQEQATALCDVISILDRIGGYMTPEDQTKLWHARQVAGMPAQTTRSTK